MAKKREVTSEEFVDLVNNLKDGQILSVDFVDDPGKIEKGDYELTYGDAPYSADEIHEPEGYSGDYDESEAVYDYSGSGLETVSNGGIFLDDSELSYNGEKMSDLSGISLVK